MAKPKIVIIGAGIGGLTAAASLRRFGFEPDVYEQAPQLGEVGAGLQLGPNAVKVLHALGLEERLLEVASGLGVGGAMPNAIALISEYSPARRRALMVTVASAGYSVGASGAGFLTARLAATHGWGAIFIVGGVSALVLSPVLMGLLPDSIRFMVLSGTPAAKLIRILRKIDPQLPPRPDFTLISSEQKLVGLPVSHLFREGRGAMTAFLWLAVFMDLLVIYYMTSWLPVTIHGVGGISVEDAAVAAALFSAAGLFGTPVVGQLMDWFGPARMLGLSFLLASACIALTGSFAASHFALKIIVFLAGFFSVGAHLGLSALAGELYPTFMRATGVGWALGIGRVGSLLSPVLGGMLLSWQWEVSSIFLAVAVPAFLAAVCVLLVGWFSSARGREMKAEAALTSASGATSQARATS